jgi:hypothetical protein
MKKKKTIFANNESLEDVICQALIFAIGTATALVIASGLIIITLNLIY